MAEIVPIFKKIRKIGIVTALKPFETLHVKCF